MSERVDRKREQIKDRILKLLDEKGKMHTKGIAGDMEMSSATVSKYLAALEGEKRVKRYDDQPPYVYWTLNEGSNEEPTS